MQIAMIAFTAVGRHLTERIQKLCPHDEFTVFTEKIPAADWVAATFRNVDAFIFVGATGIAVRLCAPHLQSKAKDPAVLVLDEKGQHVIPLISGHIGGANKLAVKLASLLGAKAVLTTATDLNNVFAVDVWAVQAGCTIPDTGQIKHISSELLAGKTVGFASDFPVEGELPEGVEREGNFRAGICVSLDGTRRPWPYTVNVIPRIAVIGAGCRRNTDSERFAAFAESTAMKHNISLHAVHTLASIDVKHDEVCLKEFATRYGLTFTTFSAEALRAVTGTFDASGFVYETVGVDNVCERAALAGQSDKAALIVSKTKQDGMTLAFSIQKWVCRF